MVATVFSAWCVGLVGKKYLLWFRGVSFSVFYIRLMSTISTCSKATYMVKKFQ